MKGVILAGGSGTRLHPLTRITNKHLLPLYDRPMVTYAVEALVGAGIDELMLVTGGTHAGEFFRLLGNGHDYGIDKLFYGYQEEAGGIADALGLAERFVARDKVCVLLADNIFERSLQPIVENFERQERGARIALAELAEDEHLRHLGVAVMEGDRVTEIVEANVAESLTTGKASGATATEPARTESPRTRTRRDHLAYLVVLLAFRGVAEDVVRGRDLLEALLGVLVPRVGVRVELLGELPVRARDLLVGRALWHAEHRVVVLLEPVPLWCHTLTLRASRGPSRDAGRGR